MALFAAPHVRMAHLTGATRIVIGTTILGRTTAAAKRTIGQFATNVFVAADVETSARLSTLVGRVLAALQAAKGERAAVHGTGPGGPPRLRRRAALKDFS